MELARTGSQVPDKKKLLLDILRKLGYITDRETGNLEIHFNDGTSISNVYKKVNMK